MAKNPVKYSQIVNDIIKAYSIGDKQALQQNIGKLLAFPNLQSSLKSDDFIMLADVKDPALTRKLGEFLRTRKDYEAIYNKFSSKSSSSRNLLFKAAFATKDGILNTFIDNYKKDKPQDLQAKLNFLKNKKIIDITSIKPEKFVEKLATLNESEVKNVLKAFDTLGTTPEFGGLISKISIEIDAKTLPGNSGVKGGGPKYTIKGIDDWLNNYRVGQYKLLASQNKSIISAANNNMALVKAYVKAGLSDASFSHKVVQDIGSISLKDKQKFLGSLNANDTELVKALKDNSLLTLDEAKYLQEGIRNSYIDEVKKSITNPKVTKGKGQTAYELAKNGYLNKDDTEIFKYVIDHKMTKQGQQNLDSFANLLTDQEVKDAFDAEVKNSYVSATDPAAKQRHLDYLTKNNLITAQDANIIENIAKSGKGMNAARKQLSDPALQKALDNKVLEDYLSNPKWDDLDNDIKARYQYEYLNANAPDRLSSLDTLKKLATTNGTVDVKGLKDRVAKIQDPGLKAEMEQRIADASDLSKNPLKSGETNPFAEYEFNNNKNYAHRQAYLDSLDASQVMDNQGKLINGWDQKGLTADEIKSIRARATLDPAIVHPHLEGWKQARQSLADAFTNPGNTDLGKIYGGVKQGIFGKPSSSGQGNSNVGVSGWKNFVKTGLVGLPVGLGVEYGINSPIREAMGGGNTGNRGLDALTDALTNPYTGIINSALVGGGTQGFAEAAGKGLGNRLAAGGIGAVKYGLSPRSLGLAGAMAGLNQLRDAENISSNNALWQAASTAAPWVQLGGAGTKIFGGNWMALPALTAAATAAVSNAAMNAQTERLGMRDTGRRYAAGEDMVGKDIDNYKGYVFLSRDGKAKDIYQIKQEMIAKGLAPSDAQNYIDTNYMAYTPEFVKGIMNNHVNKKKDWMERVERALTFYDENGNPTGRIKPANETGNHLTDTLDYAQKMATASIANDGILGGLARMGKLALLGAEGAWNELARGNTMEYKNGDPRRAMENWFAYNKQTMNKQAKEAKATSVKQEAEQQAAAQEAAQQEAAQTVAAIQQAQQAYQTPQVGINLASLTPMGGQNASGIDDLLAMYNMQQTPQGMPNLANFA